MEKRKSIHLHKLNIYLIGGGDRLFITVVLFLVGFLLITKGADIFINCTVEIGKKRIYQKLYLELL